MINKSFVEKSRDRNERLRIQGIEDFEKDIEVLKNRFSPNNRFIALSDFACRRSIYQKAKDKNKLLNIYGLKVVSVSIELFESRRSGCKPSLFSKDKYFIAPLSDFEVETYIQHLYKEIAKEGQKEFESRA